MQIYECDFWNLAHHRFTRQSSIQAFYSFNNPYPFRQSERIPERSCTRRNRLSKMHSSLLWRCVLCGMGWSRVPRFLALRLTCEDNCLDPGNDSICSGVETGACVFEFYLYYLILCSFQLKWVTWMHPRPMVLATWASTNYCSSRHPNWRRRLLNCTRDYGEDGGTVDERAFNVREEDQSAWAWMFLTDWG